MGRAVRRNLAGTQADFEAVKHKFPDIGRMVGAEVYWDSESGTLFLVAPEPWVDYLHGKCDEIPSDPLDDSEPFYFNEDEFQELMKRTAS